MTTGVMTRAHAHHRRRGELAVLRMLHSELSLREIGSELFLSLNTIKTHTRSIYLKLGASGRDEAVARGREQGLM